MVVFAFPPIPENVYRIQSADRFDPPLYLERQGSGEIKPAVLDTANAKQQWRIVYQDDGTYRIVNAKTYEGLCLQKDQAYSRLWSGGPQQVWTFETHGNAFIIGDPATASCLEIQPNNWVVSQARTNAVNQRWLLHTLEPDGLKAEKIHPVNMSKPNGHQRDDVKEGDSAGWKQPSFSYESHSALALPPLPSSVTPRIPTPAPIPVSSPTLADGNYDIINVASGYPYFPSYHSDGGGGLGGLEGPREYSLFWRNRGNVRPYAFSSWTVESIPGPQNTYRITGSLKGRRVSLFNFQSGDYVLCSGGHRTCRLIPAISRGCFHLVEADDGSGVGKAVRCDGVDVDGDKTFGAIGAYFDAEDKRQHWRFVPA